MNSDSEKPRQRGFFVEDDGPPPARPSGPVVDDKFLELSQVMNVLSRSVGDIEKQRQINETRSHVLSALVIALVNAMPPDRRTEVAKNFESAAQAMLQASTSAGRASLNREIADIRKILD